MTVYYVSLDEPAKNAEFAKALGARHILLSDDSGSVAKSYGVLGLGGLFAKRWTFYIDRDGKLAAIDRDVRTQTAGADIARKLGELGFPKRR